MMNSSNACADVACEVDWMERVSRLRNDWRVARAAHAELLALGMPRVNLLVTGSDRVIGELLEVLLPDLREPVGRWCPGDELLLPPPALVGTMIFRDIGAMPYEDQHRLLEWLQGAGGRTQTVSTTAASLLPQVEAGDFIEALYYRLNIVCLDAA